MRIVRERFQIIKEYAARNKKATICKENCLPIKATARFRLGTSFEQFCALSNLLIDQFWFYATLFLISALFFALELSLPPLIILLAVISFTLIVSPDATATIYPILLITLSMLRMYDSANYFFSVWWIGCLPIACIIFHFIYYAPIKRKKTLTGGFIAISFATLLGGLFSISAKDYFTPTALFYSLGLGVGMLLAYLIFVGYANPYQNYDTIARTARIMLWSGGYGALMLFLQYATNILPLLQPTDGIMPDLYYSYTIFSQQLQLGNNLSTILLITMPFAFYYAANAKSRAKATFCFCIAIIEGMAMVLSMSRAGFLLSYVFTAVGAAITILYCHKDGKRLIAFGIAVCVMATMIVIACAIAKDTVTLLIQSALLVYSFDKNTILIFLAIYVVLVVTVAALLALLNAPKKMQRGASYVLFSLMTVGLIMMFCLWDKVHFQFLNLDEARAKMADIAVKNFFSHPFFGVGLGYTGMQEVYTPKAGMLNCNHCALFQIIGSLGILGCFSYSYALNSQLKLFASNAVRGKSYMALALIGLYAMSMLNPGIFIPIPYAFLAVFILAAFEIEASKKESVNVQSAANIQPE